MFIRALACENPRASAVSFDNHHFRQRPNAKRAFAGVNEPKKSARLPGEAIARLLSHARDTVLFVDRSLLPALAGQARPAALRHVVVIDDRSREGAPAWRESVALANSR